MMTQKTTVCVHYEHDLYGNQFPNGKSIQVIIDWLIDVLNEIPEEYRNNSRCEFRNEFEYGVHYTTLLISYTRPETAGERTLRKTRERSATDSERNRELALLAQLRAKYPEALVTIATVSENT